MEFGAKVTVDEPTVPEGMKFDGWTDEIPETMPAHDVDIHGTYSELSSLISVNIDDDAKVTVCNLSGFILYKDASWRDVRNRLDAGLYIINGGKYLIRK